MVEVSCEALTKQDGRRAQEGGTIVGRHRRAQSLTDLQRLAR